MKNSRNSIKDAIEELERSGVTVTRTNADASIVYELSGDHFSAEVSETPQRWLGLRFQGAASMDSHRIEYDLDTDLYDLSDPKNAAFGQQIRQDIIHFLEAMLERRILVGEKKGKPALIVPCGDKYSMITKGRVLTTSQEYDTIQEAEAQGTFNPLRVP